MHPKWCQNGVQNVSIELESTFSNLYLDFVSIWGAFWSHFGFLVLLGTPAQVLKFWNFAVPHQNLQTYFEILDFSKYYDMFWTFWIFELPFQKIVNNFWNVEFLVPGQNIQIIFDFLVKISKIQNSTG